MWRVSVGLPLENLSNSNTPMGPFQMMVLASASSFWIMAVESGPLSRPSQPSGMAVAGTTLLLIRSNKHKRQKTSDIWEEKIGCGSMERGGD
jgi:hypothetical protein